jgi:hypothetical protein
MLSNSDGRNRTDVFSPSVTTTCSSSLWGSASSRLAVTVSVTLSSGDSTPSRMSTLNLDRVVFTNVLKGAGMRDALCKESVRVMSTRHSTLPKWTSDTLATTRGPTMTA